MKNASVVLLLFAILFTSVARSSETSQAGDPEMPLDEIFRKQIIIGGGGGRYYTRHPRGYQFRAIKSLTFSVQGPLNLGPRFLYLEVPMISSLMRIHWSSANGIGTYNFKSGGGTRYTLANAPFTLDTLTLDYGLRLDPIRFFPVQPYAEAGVVLGGHQLKFASTVGGQLNATGADYELKTLLWAWGYYTVLGSHVMFNKNFGLTFFWRYSRVFSNTSRLISDHFTLITDHYNAALVWSF